MNLKHKQSGFTLLELLVAMALGIIVATIVVSTTIIGLRAAQAAHRVQKLHADAISITDQLSYWMKQAKNVSVSGSTLQIVLQDDSMETVTRQNVSGINRITVNGVSITSSDINVNSLSFKSLAKSVQISATLQSTNASNQYTFNTTIAQRYAP